MDKQESEPNLNIIELRCSTCGAECQNPYDRYGETFIEWMLIHDAPPHKIIGNKIFLDLYYVYYKENHDSRGKRI